jgi:hypothetical protein
VAYRIQDQITCSGRRQKQTKGAKKVGKAKKWKGKRFNLPSQFSQAVMLSASSILPVFPSRYLASLLTGMLVVITFARELCTELT